MARKKKVMYRQKRQEIVVNGINYTEKREPYFSEIIMRARPEMNVLFKIKILVEEKIIILDGDINYHKFYTKDGLGIQEIREAIARWDKKHSLWYRFLAWMDLENWHNGQLFENRTDWFDHKRSEAVKIPEWVTDKNYNHYG